MLVRRASDSILTTFIFTVYPDQQLFRYAKRPLRRYLLGPFAGFLIAILAPVTGQRNDKSGRGIFWLGVNTMLLVGSMAACFFVDPHSAVPVAGYHPDFCGELVQQFACVNITPCAAYLPAEISARFRAPDGLPGYIGGILALAVVLWGFVPTPKGARPTTDNALNIRAVALFAPPGV